MKRKSLIRRLRRLALRSDVRLRVGTLERCSAIYIPKKNRSMIYVDIYKAGLIPCLIHELLHIYLRETLGIDSIGYENEEPMVQGLEEELVRDIIKDERSVKSWRRIIRELLRRKR